MINLSLEFNLISSENYCTYITDGTHGTHSNQETGKYLLSAKDILDGNVHIKDNSRIISEDDFNKIHKNYKLENYDVLLTVAGTIGRTAIIKNYKNNYTFQRSVAIFKTNDKIKSLWLYYYLNSPIGKQIIKSLSKGTTQLILPLKDLRNLEIPVPKNISDQKKILSILTDIDKKIEINKRINQNLENIAGNIFKRYFLDYSPFQNLTFNESIIGDVPNEWNFIKIKDVVDVRDGTHDSPSAVEIGFPLITSKHLNKYDVNKKDANKISFEDYTNINKRSLVEPFDILISMIGTVGNICYIMYDEIDFAIKNVGLFKTSKNPLLREYLLLYLKSNIVTQYIDSHLAGSTQKYISLTELRNIPIVIPPKEILTDFKDIINPIFNNIKINNLEINKLINLRDILLPKLMSGEIDVSKINLNYNND